LVSIQYFTVLSADTFLQKERTLVEPRSHGGDASTGKHAFLRRTHKDFHIAYEYSIDEPNSQRRDAVILKFAKLSLFYCKSSAGVVGGAREGGRNRHISPKEKRRKRKEEKKERSKGKK